jgi:hypothetical protein
VDAPTTVATIGDERSRGAPPLDEHTDLSVPTEVTRDAAAIVGAALDASTADATHTGTLTGPQRAMLDLERHWWQRGGAKEQAIRDTFGMTPTRYYQTLNGVLALPAALRYDAMLVGRLLRIRGQASRSRSVPG